MSRRRASWSPYAAPGIRRSYVSALEADRSHAVLSEAELTTPDAQAHMRNQQLSAENADLFWITSDMARVALDASTDVPSVDLAATLPADSGIVLFESALPPLPFTEEVGPGSVRYLDFPQFPVDGLLWARSLTDIHISALVRRERFLAEFGEPPTNSALGAVFTGASRSFPLEPMQLADQAEPEAQALAAFLQTAFTLMATPTVAEVRDIDPRTGDARARTSVPASPCEPGDVRLIDLRPMRYVRFEDDDPALGGRVYRHRWVVRGHWRQQAHGAKRALRRLVWVPSYIKGPEGAPLLEPDNVMVWRR